MFVPMLEEPAGTGGSVDTSAAIVAASSSSGDRAVAGAFSKTAACESKSAPKEAPTRAERTARNILEASVKRKDKEEVV